MRYDTYQPTSRRKPKKTKRQLYLFTILLIGLIGFWLWYSGQRSESKSDKSLIPNFSKQNFEYEKVQGKYLFSGTIVLARAVENEARRGGSVDYNQPFSKMDTFNFEQYDAGVADLECPVTTNTLSYQYQISNTVFNCRPEWLPALGEYYQLLNLSGNHVHDMGEEGFPETVEHIQKAGLQAIGNYSPRVKEDLCEVVALPVRLKKVDGNETKATLPMAFCSVHYFSFTPEQAEFETIKRYAEVMPVIGLMHVGTEYVSTAGTDQRDIARRLIDAGAEFVIGNSPHWVQNTEVYKDKLIVYSTGNFIFDQLDDETNRGLSIAASMTAAYDENMAKWLELGEQCKARDDKCLETAQEKRLSKFTLQFSFEAIGSSGGYRQITQKADPALQKAIEERANWQETLNELNNN